MLNETNDNNAVEEVNTLINNGEDTSAAKAPAGIDKDISEPRISDLVCIVQEDAEKQHQYQRRQVIRLPDGIDHHQDGNDQEELDMVPDTPDDE